MPPFLQFDYLAQLCWSLLCTTILGSALALVCWVICRCIKNKSAKYTLLLSSQLSFVPLLFTCLLLSAPFLNLQKIDLPPEQAPAQTTTPQEEQPPREIKIMQETPYGQPVSLAETQESPVPDTTSTAAPFSLKTSIETLRTYTQRYSSHAGLLWMIGVVILTLRWVLAAIGLRQLRAQSSPAPAKTLALLDQAKAGFYDGHIQLMESVKATTPMVISWLKPVILIPVGLLNNLPAAQVEALLLHEVAHIRRYDFLWNILQRVAETLFFFNPVVWLLGKEVRILREELCDHAVITRTQKPKLYAKALLSLAESSAPVLALGARNHTSPLLRRFQSILGAGANATQPKHSILEIAFVLLLSAACFLPLGADLNQDLASESLANTTKIAAPSGRILDQDGNPLAGARVILHYERDYFAPDSGIVEETVSAADGTYRFNSPMTYKKRGRDRWESAYSLFATHPDWTVGWYDIKPPPLDENPPAPQIDLILEKPTTQEFTVLTKDWKDAEGNPLPDTPLEGANVQVIYFVPHKKRPDFHPHGYNPGYVCIGNGINLAHATTDAEGKCTITNLPSNRVDFLITHPSITRGFRSCAEKVRTPKTVKGFPRASISGVLRDNSGEPIANTAIQVKARKEVKRKNYPPSYEWETWAQWITQTDDQGRYRFPALYGRGHNANKGGGGDAFYEFEIYDSDWMLTQEYIQQLKPAQHLTDFNLEASKGIPLDITVRKAGSNEPYAFAPVEVTNYRKTQNRNTDSKGRVRFYVLPGEKVSCTVNPLTSDYWAYSDSYHGKRLFFDTVSIPKSVNKHHTRLTVAPKPMKIIEGTLVLTPAQLPFEGEIIASALETEDLSLYLPKGRSLPYFDTSVVTDKLETPFAIQVPSEFDYKLAVTNKKQSLSGFADYVPNSLTQLTVASTAPQKLLMIGADHKPLSAERFTYGIFTKRGKLGREFIRANKKGVVTLPGLHPEAQYYISHDDSSYHPTLYFKAAPNKTITLNYADTELTVELIDGNGVALNAKKVEMTYLMKNGAHVMGYSSNSSYGRVSAEGKLAFKRKEIQKWLEQNYDALDVFITLQNGDLMSCNLSIDDSGITLLETVNLTQTFTQKRVELITAKSEDLQKSLDLLCVDTEGNPIEGVNCFLRGHYRYPFFTKFSSKEDFKPITPSAPDRLIVSSDDGKIEKANLNYMPGIVRLEAEGYATRWITKDWLAQGAIKVQLDKSTKCQGQILKPNGDPAAFHPIAFKTQRRNLRGRNTDFTRNLEPLRIFQITDENGHYETLLEPGQWTMEACIDEDHIVQHQFTIALGDELTLNSPLSPATHITLRFEDKADGTPLSNLAVNLGASSAPYSGAMVFRNFRGTDNKGEITFKGLLADKYSIKAFSMSHQGFTDYAKLGYSSPYLKGAPIEDWTIRGDLHNIMLNTKLGGNSYTIQCSKGTMVQGTITSDVDIPLSELAVDYLQNDGQKQSNFSSIRVNKNGSFTGYLPKAEGAEIQLCVIHATNSPKKKIAPSFSKPFIVQQGENFTVDFHVRAGASVKGKIVDTAGTPIPATNLRYKHLDGKNEPGGLAWSETDTDGNFIIKGIPPGAATIQARVGNKTFEARTLTLEEGKTHDLGTVTFEPEKE